MKRDRFPGSGETNSVFETWAFSSLRLKRVRLVHCQVNLTEHFFFRAMLLKLIHYVVFIIYTEKSNKMFRCLGTGEKFGNKNSILITATENICPHKNSVGTTENN